MRRNTSPEISYPLYLAGLATVLCGLTALNSVLMDKSFATFTGLLLCLGYAVSLTLRRIGYITRLLEAAVITAAVLIYVQVIGGKFVNELIIPANAANTPEMKLASMLLWLEVLRSFTLTSDESVVFSAIPSIVLISLTATGNVNTEVMTTFVIYLVLASYLLTYRPENRIQGIKPGFRMAVTIATMSMIIGCIVVAPIRLACIKAFAVAMPEFTKIREHAGLSGYMDPSVLQISQGPVRLSEKVVMIIRSHAVESGEAVGVNWRGRVFDRYTGHGWKSSAQSIPVIREQIENHGNGWYRYSQPDEPQGELIEQVVTPAVYVGRNVITAAEPVSIEGPYSMIRCNEFNCWRRIPGAEGAFEYKVVSALPVTDRNSLRNASTDYSVFIRSHFLQTTTSTAKAGELARSITGNISNPYDKAVAIKRYLGEHYLYDLDVPPAPPGQDAVEHFLFKSKVGYCDVFASAMVIMCREAGVPARLATGYATGDYDQETDTFLVRDMDRHAWAEAYFPDCGWVTFDPTEYTRERAESVMGRISTAIRHAINNIMGGSAIQTVIIALLVSFAVITFGSEVRKLHLAGRINGPGKLHCAAVARYHSICKSIKVHDRHLTPLEAAAAGTRAESEAHKIAQEAAELFGIIRYSPREVTAEDVNELKRLHIKLKRVIRDGG